MRYKDDDEQDREIREKLNRMTMHEKDVDNHSIKHKYTKIGNIKAPNITIDEGY